MKRNILAVLIPAWLVLCAWLAFSGRNAEVLGTFSPEAKARIERELTLLCEQIAHREVAQCGPVAWTGKHRWFGTANLRARSGWPPETVMAEVIANRGWRPSQGTGNEVLAYRRDDMHLSMLSPVGGARSVTMTTMPNDERDSNR